jgi:phage terminase large subunit-like protein
LTALVGWWLTDGREVRGGRQSVLSVAHDLKLAEEIHYVLGPILEAKYDGKVSYSFGRKEVRFKDGSIWRIAAATPAAGHGQSNDLLVVDEIWSVNSDILHNGLLPTQRARPQPLAAFFSTAGTEKSQALRRPGPSVYGGMVTRPKCRPLKP